MDNNSEKQGDINFGNIHGNVIVSKDQSGGITGHNVNTQSSGYPNKEKKPKSRLGWLFGCLGGLSSIVTILAYFELFPFNHKHDQVINKSDSIKTNIEQKAISPLDSFSLSQIKNHPKQTNKMNKEKEKKINSDISVNNVAGDVVISQGQTGGITAHTVNVGEPALPARHLSSEDKKELVLFANQSVTLTTSMADSEVKEYGQEICDYLISIGCNVSRTLYNVGIGGSPEKNRFSINGNSIFVPVNKKI
ncbi:hypothetical protein [Chitinophaga sp. LS1]|uniref:hypothetical protein n=1 Tax=Chitinophaga sp. LS1 TaxID=3051176 RepID=UPI002AAC0F02|nr:hypothetical protein [Chitinophaga sp. LS1]WPV67790.1 hypothetical protein QQL36_03490 [Chitinophaga sp. LS1]